MMPMRPVLQTGFALLLIARTVCAVDLISLDKGDIGLSQAFKRLSATESVLHVVAHPDDEDGPLLAYCARGLGLRTMLFSVTRGEGGANLISSDFFDRLGALRSLEHVKSASYYGNELYYSRAVDYGYSKTLDEARRQWQNGEPILADLVELIRRERPTIVLSRFRGDEHDGHGHHQLAGVLSEQAVLVAADPHAFPDQSQRGLVPWQVTKLYSNNLRPEWRPADQELWSVAIPTGTFDHSLGQSFAQIARFGLGFQRSQGFGGHEGEPGPRDSYYRLVRVRGEKVGPVREGSILDGLDHGPFGSLSQSLDAATRDAMVVEWREMVTHISAARQAFVTGERTTVVTKLLSSLNTARSLLDRLAQDPVRDTDRALLQPIVNRKVQDLHDALRCALAIDLRAIASRTPGQHNSIAELRYAVPGEKIQVRTRVVHQHPSPIDVRSVTLSLNGDEGNAASSSLLSHQANEMGTIEQEITIPVTTACTRPAWSRSSVHQTLYDVTGDDRFDPLPRPALQATVSVVLEGVELRWKIPVEVVYRDGDLGDVRYPLEIVPPLRVGFALNNGMLPRGQQEYVVELVAANASATTRHVAITLNAPDGWTSQSMAEVSDHLAAGQTRRLAFRLTPPVNLQEMDVVLSAQIKDLESGQIYNEDFAPVSAPDLSRLHWYVPARHRLKMIDVRVAGTPRVGYIRGSGDEVAESLRWIGITPTFLEAADLATGDLTKFDLILVGVRAYAVREDLRRWNSRLLEYVHDGGTLIVQYQTPEFDQNFGPYPYSMGNNPEEVSEEDAAVTVLEPDHRLFSFPNRISPADFEQWVEQRGSKFWTSWDERYTPLLECHDAEQAPQRGGWLVAHYGQGTYVYSAYAWYRQLPQGVPGAYRLVANLMSLPETPRP